MDLSSLRALVRNLNFEAFGVDAVLESDPPGAFDPIATRGIWLSPETEDYPGGADLRRRERSYVLAVPLADVHHGDIILAPLPPFAADLVNPPPAPGAMLRWKVDGFAGLESDHTRIRLVLAPVEET
jgi:hypothetical protein